MEKIENTKIGIYIVNFNTTELTNLLIKSILKFKHEFKYDIVVFDNSDKIKFFTNIDNVKIIDNTKNQLIYFNKILLDIRYKRLPSNNKYASFKHALTIDYILKNTPYSKILLFDSDTILKKKIDFVNSVSNISVISDIEFNGKMFRFLPYICYFNIKDIRNHSISYFDINRILGGSNPKNYFYDTGASFFQDIVKNGLNFLRINFTEYVDHLKSASWREEKSIKKSIEKFIEEHKYII